MQKKNTSIIGIKLDFRSAALPQIQKQTRPYFSITNVMQDQLKGVEHLLDYKTNPQSLEYLQGYTKRLMDICGACLGILLGLPIFCLAAIIVRLVDQVPVIFYQKRIGLNGREFDFYKLRTLKTIDTREMVILSNLERKPVYKTTRTGRFWRVTSIDEIIQFWLVLKGEMSLIGHRPLPDYYLPHLDQIAGMDKIKLAHYLKITGQYKPGMSSLSSVNGRGNLTMQEKLEYDLLYAQNAGFWYDLKLLLRTVVAVLTLRGAR